MKLTDRQLAALRSIAAYIRVWVHWSRDPADRVLAAPYRRGSFSSQTLASLQRLGLYTSGGPRVLGGGQAPILTEEGARVLAEHEAQEPQEGAAP